MSFSDHTEQLEQSFRRASLLMRNLLEGLKTRRAAWSSARPSVIVPSPELEHLAQELAREEDLRADLVRAIGKALPAPPGATSTQLHVNVTRIAAALPKTAAHSLREASDESIRLAKAVRVEVTLGQRLLRFTRDAQQHLMGQLGFPGTQTKIASGYDRRARRHHGALAVANAGTLIDGRI